MYYADLSPDLDMVSEAWDRAEDPALALPASTDNGIPILFDVADTVEAKLNGVVAFDLKTGVLSGPGNAFNMGVVFELLVWCVDGVIGAIAVSLCKTDNHFNMFSSLSA